jgi:hypothetical protein
MKAVAIRVIKRVGGWKLPLAPILGHAVTWVAVTALLAALTIGAMGLLCGITIGVAYVGSLMPGWAQFASLVAILFSILAIPITIGIRSD